MEIRQDQAVKHVTGAVERNEILIWNEELLMYVRLTAMLVNQLMELGFVSAGNNLSTVSLLVLENGSGSPHESSCIGYVDIVLGTLLAMCANDEGMFRRTIRYVWYL